MGSNHESNINQNIDVVPRKVEVIYRRKTRERKIFMDELKEIRKQRHKRFMKRIIASIGPNWYYELSEPQRRALDTLEFSIYQDVLEGRPLRSDQVVRLLGVYPRLCTEDLMHCVITGRKDPKQMLANVFGLIFGHAIDGKRAVYNFNGKLLLSAILYLGLPHLVQSLQAIFHMEPEIYKEPKPEAKVKPVLKSPYLEEMVACLYQPPKRKSQKPPPLPDLDLFNEPYEPEPLIRKPPPLPPPPPPPKKKLPRSYCDKLAGIIPLVPCSSIDNISMKPLGRRSSLRRGRRSSKISILEDKKAPFGIGSTVNKKPRRKKPVAPSTGMKNSQYVILGVSVFNNKYVFNLGSISILPPEGYMIHGGYAYINGGYLNINCGFRARPPPPTPDPCDCVAKWYDSVFQYVKDTKCYCGHYYDYGNEGAFLPEELPFFEKPTENGPFRFNYETIYDLDEKQLHVKKEFKRVWDTESMLGAPPREKKDKKKKTLGDNLKPEEYLRVALRMLRRENIAARLPDIHLVPELKEWMRNRMFGPYSSKEKIRFINQSINDWQKFWSLEVKDYVHVYPPKDTKYSGTTNWVHKHELVENFRKYTHKYKMELFKSIANFNNMMWPSMCQAQFPDKKFREIYFSYLTGRVEDLILMHPYSVKETAERKRLLANKRYSCMKPVERDE
ncbi:uncharacterized protein [Battus philenor]|uniref:uncharacterized protein n=1 Tax=Battus philenor TaxID=42288 RepID=UPI0035CF1B26